MLPDETVRRRKCSASPFFFFRFEGFRSFGSLQPTQSVVINPATIS